MLSGERCDVKLLGAE